MKNFAFTLAETLITLVIIGIVAALTVPNIIMKHQKDETVTRLKKVYSNLYNAYKQATLENGDAGDWDYSLPIKDFYIKYLSKYLIGNVCQTNTGLCKAYKFKQCPTCAYNYTYTPAVVLNDGTNLLFSYDNGFAMKVDINGAKKPNSYGKDIFLIAIHNRPNTKTCKFYDRFGFFCQWCGACQQAGVSSAGKTRAMWTNVCNSTSGSNCGGLIQFDNWTIKDDYPW